MGTLTINHNDKGHILGALLVDDDYNEWGLSGVEVLKVLSDYDPETGYEVSGKHVDGLEAYDYIGVDLKFCTVS